MSADSLDTLLEKLANGEIEAAERVFRDFEPFLRAMVRRRLTPPLRAKFDSMDVVQSVWADVWKGFREAGWQFTDQEHLRAFLARVTLQPFRQSLPAAQRRAGARAAPAMRTSPPSWPRPASPGPARSPRPTSCGRR